MTGTLLALAAIAAAVWALSLYLHPFQPCLRCARHATRRGGTGRNPGSTRSAFGPCGRCGGTGSTQRPGSKLVHRAVHRTITRIRRKDKS